MWNLIISLLMAIISYVTTKKGDSKNEGKALAAAAAGGLGAYYLTTNTEWGQDSVAWLNENVANLDGTPLTTAPTGTTVDSTGRVVLPNGTAAGSSNTNAWDVLRGWGATGTAAVIGAGTAATGLLFGKFTWTQVLLAGGFILLLLKA